MIPPLLPNPLHCVKNQHHTDPSVLLIIRSHNRDTIKNELTDDARQKPPQYHFKA